MLAAVLLMLTVTGQVIAAPEAVKQPPATQSLIPSLVIIAAGVIAALVIWRRRWYQLEDAPPRVPLTPEPSEPLILFALLVAMVLMGQAVAAAIIPLAGIELPSTAEGWERMSLEDRTKLTGGSYTGEALILLIWWWMQVAQPRRASARWGWGRSILLGLAAILLCWPITVAVGAVAETLHQILGGPAPEVIAHETLRTLLAAPRDAWYWLMIVLVVLATPVLEELMYRGLMQQLLRAAGDQLSDAGEGGSAFGRFAHRAGVLLRRPWTAIMITSAAFSAMHVGSAAVYALPGLFVLSLGFGWARERTGRLVAPIAMHASFNVGNLVLALMVEGGGG